MPEPTTPFSAFSSNTDPFKSEIERILDISFSDFNDIYLFQTGQETFQEILNTILKARDIICIEIYIFKDDESGQKLAEILKEKAKQGVQVYLLYDHFGSFLTSRALWRDLKKYGINVQVSHPFRWSAIKGYKYRNHKKLIIIDGKEMFIGGFNIADEYHGYLKKQKNIWRDTGIHIKGPIAAIMLDMFRISWSKWKDSFVHYDKKPLMIKDGVPVIPVIANSGRARRRMRKLFIYSIRNAKRSIRITTAYFFPSRRLIKALQHAAGKGVSVTLLLPGKSDVTSVLYAGKAYYTKLLKAGIDIYNYKGSILHSKTAVFDDTWSIIGSANLDKQSLRRNEESNVGILNVDFASNMYKTFMMDLQEADKIDISTWMKRPLYHKFLEKLFSAIMKRL